MAVKWSSGRFPGLLKDVDDVVNSIWNNQLSMFDDLVSMYLLVLCFVQLATSVEENLDSNGLHWAWYGYNGDAICLVLATRWNHAAM